MMKENRVQSILRIDSSARTIGSITCKLADTVISRLMKQQPDVKLIHRDLSEGVSFIDEQWIAANFTDIQQRTAAQNEKLFYSDKLVEEIETADIIVLAAPIYNFSIPAALKAWIDLICRARKTFRYTENGPEGLLKGKTIYLVMASGGVPFGSEMDFASSYLKQVLSFIGINDVRPVYAEGLNINSDNSEAAALQMIEQYLPATATA